MVKRQVYHPETGRANNVTHRGDCEIQWLQSQKNPIHLIRPNLTHPENVSVWGNVGYNPSRIFETEDHSRSSVGVGGVNDNWANRFSSCDVVRYVTSNTRIKISAIAFACWAKIMVKADQDARIYVVGKPCVDVGSVVEGYDGKLRVTFRQYRCHCVQAVWFVIQDCNGITVHRLGRLSVWLVVDLGGITF